MDIVLRVAEITAPVFVLAAIGFGWVRMGGEYPMAFVTRLGTTLAIPCLVFSTLAATEIEQGALIDMVLATLVGYGAVAAVTWALVALFRLDRRTFLAPLIFGNTGNVGLPMALFAFGETGLGYAIVLFAVMAVGTFTFGVWLVAGRTSPMAILREPMVIAAALGALFLIAGWDVPLWIDNSVGLIGQMAIPLMLLTLGVAVARLRPAALGRAIWLSLTKAGIGLGLGLGTGWLLGLAPLPLAVLVLQLTTPVAVTSYLLAEKYNADGEAVAGLVVVSTLLSVLVLPLVIGLLMPT